MIGFAGIYKNDAQWSAFENDALSAMIQRLQGVENSTPQSLSLTANNGDTCFKLSVLHRQTEIITKEVGDWQGVLVGHLFDDLLSESELLEQFVTRYAQTPNEAMLSLNGDFSVFIFNKESRQLSAIRDRGGAKTLFYAHYPTGSMFSSGMRAIAKSPLLKEKNIDLKGLWMNMAYPAPPQPLTCIEGIECLQRGSSLSISGQSAQHSSYWEIPSRSVDANLSMEDSVELVSKAMDNAVRRRIARSEHIGSTLSGGVDSAYLTVLAHQHEATTKAFTFKLGDQQFASLNEDDVASLTAKKHGIEHHIESFDYKDFTGNINELVKLYEQPGISLGAYHSIAKLGHKLGFHGVVNGLAGDELFGGFHFFKHLEYWKWLRMFNPIAALLPSNRHKGIDKFKKIAGAGTIDEYYSRAFAIFLDKELKKVFHGAEFNALETLQSCYNPHKVTFPDNTSGLMHYMFANCPNHHLYRFETFSNHFGIEGIYPFLDNEVIDVSFQIPSIQKVQGHKRKIVLKKAAAPYIVKPALTENKRGVGVPINKWLDSHLKDITDQKLSQLKQREIFNPSYIDHMKATYPEGYGKKIWKLVMTELWLEEFID